MVLELREVVLELLELVLELLKVVLELLELVLELLELVLELLELVLSLSLSYLNVFLVSAVGVTIFCCSYCFCPFFMCLSYIGRCRTS